MHIDTTTTLLSVIRIHRGLAKMLVRLQDGLFHLFVCHAGVFIMVVQAGAKVGWKHGMPGMRQRHVFD